jgi:hypothetical protein
MPPHELNLKTDSIIILLRNINIKLGLCNGTRMRVLRLMENVIEAECIKTGRRALISRMPLTSELDNLPFRLRRLQFPIRPGYTLTSNKSQGQTVDRIGIYLPQPYFAHGQLYVSFSRVKSCENVKILILDTHNQGRVTLNMDHFYTMNIVYRELLYEQDMNQPVEQLTLANDSQLQDASNLIEQAENLNQVSVNNQEDIEFDIEDEIDQCNTLNTNFNDDIDEITSLTNSDSANEQRKMSQSLSQISLR